MILEGVCMLSNPSEAKYVIEDLKREINELNEKQSQALQSAVYVGLSRDEGNKYDERLKRIGKLRQELWLLEGPTPD